MDEDTILENGGRNNKIDRFDLSHLAMTGDKTAKTLTLTADMHKTDHNHHTKTDHMTAWFAWIAPHFQRKFPTKYPSDLDHSYTPL